MATLRKLFTVTLIVSFLAGLMPIPTPAHAAPVLPSTTITKPVAGAGLGSLVKAKSLALGRDIAYHINPQVQARLPQLASQPVPGAATSTEYGLKGMGLWQEPGRVLLRWMPPGDWIPDGGYSLFRLVDGKASPLAHGLGTDNPTDAQIAQISSQIAKTGASPASDLAGFVRDLRAGTRLTADVRRALGGRSLSDVSKTQPSVSGAKIISGRDSFVERFAGALQKTTAAPTVQVKDDLQIMPQQAVPDPGASAAAKPGQQSATPLQADLVGNLLANRRSILTMANLEFQAALASGLGYVDELPKLKAGTAVGYVLAPTALISSQAQNVLPPNMLRVKPQITVEVGKEAPLSAPGELEGYGMDGQVFLRWEPTADDATRTILAGYIVERREGDGAFSALNRTTPAVVGYTADGKGNLAEASAFFTDKDLQNGDRLSYRIYGIDVFGRATPLSNEIAVDVVKTLPPPAPTLTQPTLVITQGAQGPAMPKRPNPVLPTIPTKRLVSPNQWRPLMERGQINQILLKRLEDEGVITEARIQELIRQGVITQKLVDEVLASDWAQAYASETVRQVQLEDRIADIRAKNPDSPGIVLRVSHSLEMTAAGAAPALAADLTEYRIYRSKAEGKRRFGSAGLLATLPVPGNELLVPADPESEVLYFDTDVEPGYTYAYWVTAMDSWGNESVIADDAQIQGFPLKTKPDEPDGVQAEFRVNGQVVAPQPVPGFAERLRGIQPQTPTAVTKNTSIIGTMAALGLNYPHSVIVVEAGNVLPDGSLNVRWLPDADPDLQGYKVYRAQDPLAVPDQPIPSATEVRQYEFELVYDNVTATQVKDKVKLPAQGRYFYMIQKILPITPKKTSPWLRGGWVTLTWDQNSDPQIKGYRIYRAEYPRGAAQELDDAVPDSKLTWSLVKQLVQGNKYEEAQDQSQVHYYKYMVKAVTIWGMESPGAVLSVPVRIPATVPPAQPALLTPVPMPGQVMVRWKPVPDATRYTVYRTSTSLPQVNPDQLSALMRQMGIPLPVRNVRADMVADLRAMMPRLSDSQRLDLFQRLRTKFGMLALAPYAKLDLESALAVVWQPAGSVDVDFTDNETAVANGDLMTFIDDAAQHGQTYLYTVEAENADDGLASGKPSPVSASPLKGVGPDAPSAFKAEAAADGVRLSWKPYENEARIGYVVFRGQSEEGPWRQASPLLDIPTFTDTAATARESWYRVITIDEVGLVSAATAPTQAFRLTSVRPAKPGLSALPNLRVPTVPPPSSGTPTLTRVPSVIKVAGFTVENVTPNSLGSATGDLLVPGLSPISVRVTAQKMSQNTLVQGSVSLASPYSESIEDMELRITGLTFAIDTGKLTVTGDIAVPYLTPETGSAIPFKDAVLTPLGDLHIAAVPDLWVSSFKLTNLGSIVIPLDGDVKGVTFSDATMTSSLGQLTRDNKGIQFRSTNLWINLAGELTGSFAAVPGTMELVVPRNLAVSVTAGRLAFVDGQVDPAASRISGGVLLPYAPGAVPSGGAGAQAGTSSGGRYAYSQIGTGPMDSAAQHAVQSSLDWLMNRLVVDAAPPIPAGNRAAVPFAIDAWNGYSLEPVAEQTSALPPAAVTVGNAAMELQASQVEVFLPAREPSDAPEEAGGWEYVGVKVVQGVLSLPSTVVKSSTAGAAQAVKLDVNGTVYYDRTGLVGRVDDEDQPAGTSIPVLLNDSVLATVTSAGVDLQAGEARVILAGHIDAPQLGNGKVLAFRGFNEPKAGGFQFAIGRDRGAAKANHAFITGGRLEGTDLFVDGTIHVDTVQVAAVDVAFVNLRLQAPVAGGDLRPAAPGTPEYGEVLLTKPVWAKINGFDMEMRAVRWTAEGDALLLGAVKLADNLPLPLPYDAGKVQISSGVGQTPGLGAVATQAEASPIDISMDMDFEYEDFMKVHVVVGWINNEFQGTGDFTFSFEHPEDADKDAAADAPTPKRDAAGVAEVRIGSRDGHTYWAIKVALKQDQKKPAYPIFLGPIQVNALLGIIGYNLELPKNPDGTFDVPDNFEKDYNTKVFDLDPQGDGNIFFVADAQMTIWYAGLPLCDLNPARLIVESGPNIQLDVTVTHDNPVAGHVVLGIGRIGYYHPVRRFLLSLEIKDYQLDMPMIASFSGRMSGATLLLDISPDRFIFNMSYPKMVRVWLPPTATMGLPWTFGLGFAYEHVGATDKIMFKTLAGLDTGEQILGGFLYVRGYLTVTGEIVYTIPKEFMLEVTLDGGAQAGVNVLGARHQIAELGVHAPGTLTYNGAWTIRASATVYYHIDLWLWEEDGSTTWEILEKTM